MFGREQSRDATAAGCDDWQAARHAAGRQGQRTATQPVGQASALSQRTARNRRLAGELSSHRISQDGQAPSAAYARCLSMSRSTEPEGNSWGGWGGRKSNKQRVKEAITRAKARSFSTQKGRDVHKAAGRLWRGAARRHEMSRGAKGVCADGRRPSHRREPRWRVTSFSHAQSRRWGGVGLVWVLVSRGAGESTWLIANSGRNGPPLTEAHLTHGPKKKQEATGLQSTRCCVW